MDKDIIKSLDNLSKALEKISESLSKNNKEKKSAIGEALSSGKFTEQIDGINKSILSIKDDTTKILENQETILKLQKEQNKKENEKLKATKTPGKQQTITGVAKEEKEKNSPGFSLKKDLNKLKDGIGVIVLIAASILAIGMAFKVIGGVDWKSVLALSVALPLIAIAFEKVGKMKLTLPQMLGVVGMTTAMALSIVLSSMILRKVQIVNENQLLTSVLIAVAFGAASFGISKLVKNFKGISTGEALEASFILPLILIGVSVAISASSRILQYVKPINLNQSLTLVMIAAAFGAISFGLGKLLSSFKNISVQDAQKAALLMPITLLGISAAIVGSSWLLQLVKPVGIWQGLTAIMIAATFTVLAFGLSKIIKSLQGVDKGTAIAVSLLMPIVFIGLSYAIAKSSQLLGTVVPIKFEQALTSIFISGVFVVLSYAIAPLMKGIKGATIKDVALGTSMILLMVGSIYVASLIINKISKIPMENLVSFVEVGIAVSVASLALGLGIFLLNKLGVSVGDITKGSASILILATTLSLSSLILNLGSYRKYPSLMWTLGVGLSLVVFGSAAFILGELAEGPGASALAIGGISILGLALVMVGVDKILSLSDFQKFPSLTWTLGVGVSLVAFGASAVILGAIAMSGIGAGAMIAGGLSILGLALVMVGVDKILSLSDFQKFPSLTWTLGVGVSLVAFGASAVILGAIAMSGIGAGAMIAGGLSILGLALVMVGVDKILSLSDFQKFPSFEWAKGVGETFLEFGSAALIIGTIAATGVGAVALVLGGVAILALALVVVATDKIISLGQYKKFPSFEWAKGVGETFLEFGKSVSQLGGLHLLDMAQGLSALPILATNIVMIDKIISLGQYKKYPDPKWAMGIGNSFVLFSRFVVGLGQLKLSELYQGLISVIKISNSIPLIDKIISAGTYKKYPSESWAEGVGDSITSFAKSVVMLGDEGGFFSKKVSISKGIDSIKNISKSIVDIDKILSKGQFKQFPNKDWADNVSYSIQKFQKIIDSLSFRSSKNILSALGFGKNPLTEAISNISILSQVFDKLSKSIKSFSASIETIDSDKLAAVNSLSSSVVMLSLMDPDQFDQMMDKLEQRSGIFNDIIKQLDEKRKIEVGKTGVNILTNKEKDQSDQFDMLGQKMDRVANILSDMTPVLGSKGSLKSWISSHKTDVQISTIGGNNIPNTQKSDKRIKNIIKKIGESGKGIGIYLFTYLFDNTTVYQGVMAQDLLGTEFEDAVVKNKNGMYSVDYSKIDVEFKKVNI